MEKFKPKIHAAVGIVLDTNSNKILLSKRLPSQTYSGYWELPGGKIEQGETPVIAIERELYEEISINNIVSKHCDTKIINYPEHDVILEIFLITDYHGSAHGKEGQETSWVTPDSLSNITPLLPGTGEIVQTIFNSR